jgi:hypothetical protein
VSRDGSTVNLAGIVVQCVESGESDVSDGDGHFEVDAPRGEPFRLKVDDPATAGDEAGGDCTEGDDGDFDEQDLDGDEVEIGALEDGEFCDVEITIEDGEIVCINVSKGDGEHEDGERESGEARLVGAEGTEAYGEVEVGAKGECSWMEIEVGGLAPEATYELFLVDGDTLWPLDGLTTNAEGEGHRALESCGGDRPLPFGVASVAELAGLGILVKDALGTVVLEGTVPEVGSDDHHEGDDAEDGDDGEEGDDEHEGDGDAKDGDGEDGIKDDDGEHEEETEKD